MFELWWVLVPLCIIFAFGVFFFVLIVATALWETRLLVAYELPMPGQELPQTSYAQQANTTVSQLGLLHHGTFHHGKGGMYRVRYDFWLAPDRSTVLLVGGGTIARLPMNAVWIASPLKDGRYLVTTDWRGETDLSGLLELEIHMDVSPVFLVDRHRFRLKGSLVPPVPLSEQPLGDYLLMRKRQVERMVEQGDARWLDFQQSSWKHTLKGALRFYFVSIWGVGRRGVVK